MKLHDSLSRLRDGLQFMDNGNPVHKYVGKNFIEPGTALSRHVWKYRTALVLIGHVWEAVGHSVGLATLSNVSESIQGILYDATTLTFPQRHVEPLSSCMRSPLSDEQIADIELPGDPVQQDVFEVEKSVPIELAGAPVIIPQGSAGGHQSPPESLWTQGKEVSLSSTVRELQEACIYVGVNASGSKRKLYDRLCGYFSTLYQKDLDVIKNNLQQEMLGPRPSVQTPADEKPEDRLEIERHEATHLPFASWCEVCVKTKSRDDKTLQNADVDTEHSGIPKIQLDWMYLGQKCPALVMIDADSRYGAICPARSKGAWRSIAEFVVRFSLELNHLDDVCFIMDSEPATLGLLDIIVMARQEMGYKATKQHGKPYHKGRTARVERYIQTVKRQAAALTVNIEDKIHEKLDDLHCLRAWALNHSEFF